MTREEAINNLNMISVAFVEPVTKEQRKLIEDTFGMAINALEQLTSYEQTINKLTKAISEQRNVLDEMFENIKTEIDFIPTYGAKFADGSINVHVNKKDVLEIIDKYRGEEDEIDN